MPVTDPVATLRAALSDVAAGLRGDAPATLVRLDRPPRPELGDYSTNLPLMIAGSIGDPPRVVAERLGALLSERLGSDLARIEVAGPGFLNLSMAEGWWRRAASGMLAAGDSFGAAGAEPPEQILLEFVSANPTGPLTVASGRHAAYGDALARILSFHGHAVEREYYVNDQGGQIDRFAESIRARAHGEEPPKDGYQGAYVIDLARRIEGAGELPPDELARRGVALMIEEIQATLGRARVAHGGFFSERALHERGALDGALALLEEGGSLYRHEGAVWLRTSVYGDDKDRVLRRSSGELTYFASDIAYHEDKRERGFDRLIDVLGADHHGYVGRMRAAWQALGGDPGHFELVIMQLVNLLERGQRVQMSKRGGEFVTLDELIEDIGVDAVRYFLVQRSHETTLDLDLSLARAESQDNPVYYVQYAHARIASILRNAGADRLRTVLSADLTGASGSLHPSELALLKRLLELPAEVAIAAERRAPHRIAAYAHEAAQDFSAFYRDCRVVGAAEDGGDEAFRIALCVQAGRVLARALELLGVAAPEQM